MNNISHPSIATGQDDWRKWTVEQWKDKATNNAHCFRSPGGLANIEMVEALGKALTPQFSRTLFPAWNAHTYADFQWNAALSLLSQDWKWDASRNADCNPWQDLESIADVGEADGVAIAITHYVRKRQGAAA